MVLLPVLFYKRKKTGACKTNGRRAFLVITKCTGSTGLKSCVQNVLEKRFKEVHSRRDINVITPQENERIRISTE